MKVRSCVTYALLVIVIAFLVEIAIEIALRQEYIVHDKGVIVISGTSTGIGRDAAFSLASRGYIVYCGVRSQKDIDSIQTESISRKLQNNIKPIKLDVVKSSHIQSVLEEVTKFLKEESSAGLPLVGVINNAGISSRFPLEVVPIETAKEMFEVNFWGAVELTQAFLPLLREHKGRVLFISSLLGKTALPGSGIYSATKFAIEAVVDTLRIELAPFSVSVTSILPGYIKTPIEDKGYVNYKSILTPTQYSTYEHFFVEHPAKREKNFSNAPGMEVTSAAILDAITNPFPNTRYFPGTAGVFPGWIVPFFLSLVPDRFMDHLKTRVV